MFATWPHNNFTRTSWRSLVSHLLPSLLDVDEESIYTFSKFVAALQTLRVTIGQLLSGVSCLTKFGQHGMSAWLLLR